MSTSAGAEFTVNNLTADAGFAVSVAGHNDGSFLVSWVALTEPIGEDGDSRNSYDILGRTYAGAHATSNDFLVNTEQRDGQFNPQAAARADGSYVVAYSSGEENHLEGTFAASQILSNDGTRVGPEQFGDYSYYHRSPDVAISPDGRYVVVSAEEEQGEAQFHAANGMITNVYDFGSIDTTQVGVTALGNGGHLLLWHGYPSYDGVGEDGSTSVSGLYAQAQSPDGSAGAPFLIAATDGRNVDPSAKSILDGRAVVVWSDSGDVQFAIVDASSGKVSSPLSVGSHVGEDHAEVAVLGNGDFVVTWTDDNGADGSGTAVEARIFHPDGSAAGDAFVVNTRTAGDQEMPSVAAIGSDGFVIGWQGPDGIEARIFNEAIAATTSPLYTRPGTIDLSPSANQAATGAAGANSFYVDVANMSGQDRIAEFGKADVLLTTAKLYDSNGDSVIKFGKNGVLDLDGPGGASDTIRFGAGTALRYLGVSDGLYAYADARVRPNGAIEGTLSNDTLKGDAAGGKAETFFYDTALGASLGHDQIRSFGASDIFVTTTKITDANGDGVIDFGRDQMLDIGETHVSLFGTNGSAITSLEFDGTVQRSGETYYVYSLQGSAANAAGLHF